MAGPAKPVAVYRHYDDQGRLLYVGASQNPFIRYSNHLSASKWAVLSVRMEIEWHPTRKEAYDAERRAIFAEQPIFNDKKPFKQRVKRATKAKSEGATALAHWINDQGCTQAEIAKALGLDQSLICRMIAGRRAPNAEAATKIEEVTGGAVPVASWPRLAEPERNVDRDARICDLHAKGLTDADIAREIGMSQPGVRAVRLHFGLPKNKVRPRSKHEAAIREMIARGLTASESARELGIASPSLFAIVRRLGLKFHVDGRSQAVNPGRIAHAARVERIRNLAAEGLTVTEVAHRLGVPQPTISKIKAKHGIEFPAQRPRSLPSMTA